MGAPLFPRPFSPREKGVFIPLPPGEGTRVRDILRDFS